MITGANDLFQRPIAVSVAKALLYPGSQVTASTENSSVYNDSDTCTIPADDETEAVDSFSTAMTDASAVARYGLNAISTHHQLLDRDAALRRISSALIQRRRLALIDLSQRGLTASDAHLVQNVLRTCPTLSVLKLGYNSLGDAGCITICQDIRMHPSLTVFDVGFNSIGDKGCEAVARALKGNSVLTKLYLSGNSFGYVGCSALAEAVEHGCGLISLHLTANKAGSRGISQLMNATTLNQRKVHERQVAELQTKEKFSRSERSATEVANDLLANIGVPACKELASEPESSRGELLPICNLQEMFFGGTAMKSGGCLSVSNMLLTNLSLRVLSLSDNGLTDDDIALLSQSLSRNKSLPLEKLQLSFNQISCVGVEALMNAVWGSQTLTEVKLDNNQIRDRGAQLAAVVLTSVDLQVLDMGFNRITTVGVKALMKALAENTCVVALTLSGNALDTNSAKGVSYALAFNKNLKEFYMDHCSLGHAAQRHIAAGIVSNSNIVLKRLTGFPLGDATVSLGFPNAMGQWSNDQVLTFIRMMWEKDAVIKRQPHSVRKILPANKVDPSQPGIAQQEIQGLRDPKTVVAVARKAFEELGDSGGKSLLVNMEDASLQCPIVSACDMVLEKSPCGTLRVPSFKNLSVSNAVEKHVDDASTVSSGSDFDNELEGSEVDGHDSAKNERALEWFEQYKEMLVKSESDVFDGVEFDVLHRYFFSPHERVGDKRCVTMHTYEHFVSSALTTDLEEYCPQSPVLSDHFSGDSDSSSKYNDTPEATNVAVTLSNSDAAATHLAKSGLQRKLSYRYLTESVAKSPALEGAKAVAVGDSAVGRRRQVSQMSNRQIVCQSFQPATKRARGSERCRIDRYPRVKKTVEILNRQTLNHKALTLLKRLKLSEDIFADEKVAFQTNGICPNKPKHLLASDVETILLDIM